MLDVIVDLSHHNGFPDYAKAATGGLEGVIHKATQGTTGADPTYAAAENAARAAGLRWGAYHFGTGGDGVAQADHFLSTVANPDRTLLALDFEPNPGGPSMTLIEAHAFVTRVQQRTGRWPGFYSGHFIKEQLGSSHDAILANCWLWLAQYASAPIVPPCWSTWTIWQYSNGAVPSPSPAPVNGIGHCDRDRFNGAQAELDALWPA